MRIGDSSNLADINSVSVLPGNGEGYNNGSLVIWTGAPYFAPRYFINEGTNNAVDWKPIQKMVPLAGNPNELNTTAYFGDMIYDTNACVKYVQTTRPSGTVWEPF